MAREESKKPNTTARRKKTDPVAGSPVTIGGGAGIGKGNAASIEYVANHWSYTAGKLTRNDGANRIITIELTHPILGPIKFSGIDISNIEIKFE